MKTLLAVMLMSLAFGAQAQTLKTQQFEDQWEKPVSLNAKKKWLILSQNKSSGEAVKEAFSELKLKDLADHQLLYIADISGMPSFISAMFAIPKMQDYTFKIGLIRDEAQLKELQLGDVNKEQVFVVKLNNLEVVSSQSLADKEALIAFLKTQVLTDNTSK